MTPIEEHATKALELAVRYYNRCEELEEIIELFCLDAEDQQRSMESLKVYGEMCAEKMREACAAECEKHNWGQAPAMIERAIRALEIEP